MSTPLRVLIVEDSQADTLLIIREFRKGGYAPAFERIETEEAMRAALSRQAWDIVISDYTLPRFNGFSALQTLQSSKIDIPFILISGTIEEETAVQAMKAGAHDFITKRKLTRLVPVVERELKEAKVREEHRRAAEELQRYHSGLEKMIEARTAALKTANEALRQEVEERIRTEHALRAMEEEVRHLAHHDALTGLPNRRLFMDIADIEMAKAQRRRDKLGIFFLDLDRFKEINDTLGHEAGDELLKAVAARLKACLRTSDTIARIGGDEFNAILSNISRTEDITDIIHKIIESFQKSFLIAGHELHATTSIGISVYPDDGTTMDTLLKHADIAMYCAKENGRNGYKFYNPAINILSIERVKLESRLRQTIERGELIAYYQPQINIAGWRIISAEALVRWQHPEMGLLEPQHFIPAAEDSGFIVDIDEWVLRTACSQIKSNMDAGLPPVRITVNLSARQFQNPELVGKIEKIMGETGASPECLDIEVTESVAMSDIERTIDRLNELTEMGIRISIDDFGTGYSSLSYLKRLPIQKLKIDKSFIHDIATDSDDRAIISAVTAMAHTMKMKVIAEGVETEGQLAFLREIGCEEMQGYLFSGPLPAEEFMELIAAGK